MGLIAYTISWSRSFWGGEMNRSLKFLVVMSVIFVMAIGGCATTDMKVAMVGDSAIRQTALDEAVKTYIPPGQYHAAISPSARRKYRKDALNALIERELLYKEAVIRGIKVSDEAVEKIVLKNIKRLGSKENLGVALSERGMTMRSFREKIRKDQSVYILLGDLAKESQYSEKELTQYYIKDKAKFRMPESVRLWHILIRVPPGATKKEIGKKKKLAEEILKKINSGGDVGTLAQKFSDGPYRVKGGDLGFVHKGRLEPELEKAAFSLKEGETSGLIRTIYGFDILKAGKRRPAREMSFEDVKGELGRYLAEKRFKEKKAALIKKLRKEYPVVIYPHDKKAGAGHEGQEGRNG